MKRLSQSVEADLKELSGAVGANDYLISIEQMDDYWVLNGVLNVLAPNSVFVGGFHNLHVGNCS